MPPARSSARGGRRGRGRGRGYRGGSAAARARGKRAADVEAIELSDDDVKPDSQTNPTKEEIASADGCRADVSGKRPPEAPEEDDQMILSTRNLKCCRKLTMAADAATAEVHVAEVSEVRLSDDKEATNLAPCGELKCRNIAEDTFNGVVASKAGVVEEDINNPSDDAGGLKMPPYRKSKRLQSKPTQEQDLHNDESEDDVFSDSLSSSDDDKKASKLIPQRKSKRLRERFKCGYVSSEMSEDKDTWQSSSDNDDDSLRPLRRSKRCRYRLRTTNIISDDGGESDNVDNHKKAIPCRRMSKRLQEKWKVDHVSDESCAEALSCKLPASLSSGSA